MAGSSLRNERDTLNLTFSTPRKSSIGTHTIQSLVSPYELSAHSHIFPAWRGERDVSMFCQLILLPRGVSFVVIITNLEGWPPNTLHFQASPRCPPSPAPTQSCRAFLPSKHCSVPSNSIYCLLPLLKLFRERLCFNYYNTLASKADMAVNNCVFHE